MMKVFVTKYALTTGILVIEARRVEAVPHMVEDIRQRFPTYYHKPHWHETWEEAQYQAERMQAKAIIAARKKLSKLERMTFTEIRQNGK